MEKEETLGNRLRQIMQERGLNYEAFGKLLHMRPQTLNRYVLDQRSPKAEVVTEMAEQLGVDALWLQGYRVPRERPANPLEERGSRMAPVLSEIPAGCPSLESVEPEGYAAADVADEAQFCYLRMPDDSMENAGIRPGDLVLLRKQESAKTGQIVACQADWESGELRRYCQQGELVILQPDNPAYQPRIVPMEAFTTGAARIFGVAVRLVRNL